MQRNKTKLKTRKYTLRLFYYTPSQLYKFNENTNYKLREYVRVLLESQTNSDMCR